MRKLLLFIAGCFLIITSCNKSITEENNKEIEASAVSGERKCASHEVLEEQLKADPTLRKRMADIESFTRQFADDRLNYRLLPDGTIEIPVVFNVLYKTTAQNVSLTQLQSQIDVMNEDFGGTNSGGSTSDRLRFRRPRCLPFLVRDPK